MHVLVKSAGIPLLAAIILSTTTAIASSAQAGLRRATLRGVVLDSATRSGARRSRVCVLIPTGPGASLTRCSGVDTSGAYQIDSLPRGTLRVGIDCEMIRGFGKSLAAVNVAIDSDSVRREWVVSTVGCDPRPIRRVTGVFRGHFNSAFESSEFVPCAADAWFIPGDSLESYPYPVRAAWASWPETVVMQWQNAPTDKYGNGRYYVKWRGTAVGPGSYGHMGGAAFAFIVDSILEMRAPARSDCR